MYPIAINVNAPSKLDTVICVVVPQSTEGEVAPLAPALLSVTDINGMSLKGSSKYIEHLLFMFALTSEDIVNCIMRSLSIFIFLRVAFLQFVTLLVTSLFSTLNKFSTVENLITIESYQNWNIGNGLTSSSAKVYKIGELKFVHISFTTDKVLTKFNFKFPVTFKEPPYVSYTDNGGGATLGVPFGIDWATTTGVLLSEVQSATMLVVGI